MSALNPGSSYFGRKVRGRRNNRNEELLLFYQNVRGLRSKIAKFYKNVLQSASDIIALTETFLTSSILDAELFPPGYRIFRKDRGADAGWGGVLLAVKDRYHAHLITDVDGWSSTMELLFVVIRVNNVKILVCVVYLPPDCRDEQYCNVLACIENAICKYSTYRIIIVGDFNLNSCSKNVLYQVECFQHFCDLEQLNNICNVHGGILDLVLVRPGGDAVEVVGDVEPLVPIDLYHPPLEVSIAIPRRNGSSEIRTALGTNPPSWNFRKADFCALYASISDIDWTDVLVQTDTNLAVDTFYDALSETINRFVPLKKQSNSVARYSYPSWYTSELIRYIKLKYFNLKKFKSLGLEYNREVYKYYRTLVKDLIDRDYRNYLLSAERDICRDPSKFWDFVKSKKHQSSQHLEYMLNGEVIVDQDAVDTFADYFSSVFHGEIPELDSEKASRLTDNHVATHSVSITLIGVIELRKAAKRLRSSSSAGPDGIPPYMVKDCLSALERPLLHIFNLALQSAIYPTKWKVSRVIPIPKDTKSTEISTHRPIAILSAFGKLFESIINSSLIKQISNQLDDAQHGFRGARSTVTNHICFFDYVLSQMDSNRQVDAIYFDFRKAFDLVDNDVLLKKCSILGFTPKLLSFLADYLKDRRQYVQVSSFRSNEFFTRSGVSQGSNLGPTQFSIMVNDLGKCLTGAYFLLFADDLKLMHPVNNIADCNSLQRVVDAVAQWSAINKLPLNALKCKIISFTRSLNPIHANYHLSGVPLVRVNSIQDLGLTIDTRLSMHDHIINIVKSANKVLGFVIRTAYQFRDPKVAVILYNAYVRSKLEYNAIVWDPHEELYSLMIEKVQRKFARYLYKRLYGYYPFLFPSLFVSGMVGIDSLKLRRKVRLLVHYCRLLRHKVDNPSVLERLALFVPNRYVSMVNRRGRRARDLFAVPQARTLQGYNAPTTRAIISLNDFLALDRNADVFADNMSKLIDAITRYANISYF